MINPDTLNRKELALLIPELIEKRNKKVDPSVVSGEACPREQGE
jgi:hypothetical protein